MKRFIPALLVGLALFGSAPASAQTGEDFDMRFDLTYTPLRVSTSNPSGVVSSNLNAFTFGGEGRVFQGLIFGGNYTRGTGNSLTVTGVAGNQVVTGVGFSDPEFADLKLYMKVPFNWQEFANSDRTMGPKPRYSPFYAYFGYKNTTLNATAPTTMPTIGRLNIESASGGGLGLGADVAFDPLSLYGQFVYYPTLFTKNVGVAGPGGAADGFLRVYEADLGIRTNLGDSPIQAKLGYHFESHQAQNVNLRYDGFQIGASASF